MFELINSMKKIIWPTLIVLLFVSSGCSKLLLPDLSELGKQDVTETEIASLVPTVNHTPNINIDVNVNQEININSNTNELESFHALPISDLQLISVDKDVLIKWKGDAPMFKVYRAWAYPNETSSYQLVAITTEKFYLVENAYWSGFHYYAIQPERGSLSNYIMYSPRY